MMNKCCYINMIKYFFISVVRLINTVENMEIEAKWSEVGCIYSRIVTCKSKMVFG